MLHAYVLYGVAGLMLVVRGIETEQRDSRGGASWNEVITDIGNERWTDYYIRCLHPDVIRPLIRGDLPKRLQDPEFRQRVSASLNLHATPGVYLCQFHQTGHLQPGDSQETADTLEQRRGAGLTLRQWLMVVDDCRLYSDVNNPASRNLAEQIDSAYRTTRATNYASNQRRWQSGTRQQNFAGLEEFLNMMDRRWLNWARAQLGTPNEWILDVPMVRAPAVVGQSKNVTERASHHLALSGSSYVHSLISCIVKFRFAYRFDRSVWQLARVERPDHMNLCEAIFSILASAYTWELGLNQTVSGASHQAGSHALTASALNQIYQQNRDENLRLGNVDKSLMLDEQLVQRIKEIKAFDKIKDQKFAELDEREKRVVEKGRKMDTAFEALMAREMSGLIRLQHRQALEASRAAPA
ncbi:hypothetical protein UCRPC4_g01043 [Phaeomoniella chlamydospora]|uniref:Uncharacterized protein n=1 Tax=Phaeomoniella chlamydospora TaxID=158046 RepID=A0A0G2GW45_PHACM|nr:hypothetical protein UCRPC4_g01043 [Phaeomoniella chlamydospora]